MVSATRGLLNEYDTSATSSGELDLQTSTSAGQGGYAFFVNGGDAAGFAADIGGVVNVDGAGGTISGTGSIIDINDYGTAGVQTTQIIDNTSTVGTPDSFGRVTVSLALTTTAIGGIGMAGYIVDGTRIRLVENSNDPNDIFFGVTGGTAIAQGANVGTYSATTAAGSTYVFQATGQDGNGYIQIAGVLTLNPDLTTVSGSMNYNDFSGSGSLTPSALTGNYSVDPSGDVTLTNITDGVTFFGITGQLYLSDGVHGSMAFMDTGDAEGGPAYFSTGAGSFTAASFSGAYGLNATGLAVGSLPSSGGVEFDSIGTASSDGVAVVTGAFDQNIQFGAQVPDIPLTDGYTSDPSGVFTGTLTGFDVTAANTATVSYYLADPDASGLAEQVVAIQTDPAQLTLGYFEISQ
jgi:hypothetical protein